MESTIMPADTAPHLAQGIEWSDIFSGRRDIYGRVPGDPMFVGHVPAPSEGRVLAEPATLKSEKVPSA